jgi:hypothetical protein
MRCTLELAEFCLLVQRQGKTPVVWRNHGEP